MICICGCGQRARARHHAVYVQELRRVAPGTREFRLLRSDERNLVPVDWPCHDRHHWRVTPFALGGLPDSVFEFAAEVLGPGRAFEYLRRRYAGEDRRLDALLGAWEATA